MRGLTLALRPTTKHTTTTITAATTTTGTTMATTVIRGCCSRSSHRWALLRSRGVGAHLRLAKPQLLPRLQPQLPHMWPTLQALVALPRLQQQVLQCAVRAIRRRPRLCGPPAPPMSCCVNRAQMSTHILRPLWHGCVPCRCRAKSAAVCALLRCCCALGPQPRFGKMATRRPQTRCSRSGRSIHRARRCRSRFQWQMASVLSLRLLRAAASRLLPRCWRSSPAPSLSPPAYIQKPALRLRGACSGGPQLCCHPRALVTRLSTTVPWRI